MGPLVPFGIISSDFDLIIAFFIGFAFGYILEQAGFSTSRKLVGVFYGYDFVVLRVFFTAAITAIIGLIILDYFNIIDLRYVYINPTFWASAIIGGAIMGLGFIMGGFCPGTSIVAAVTGKIDAIIFVFGGYIGILIFGEVYPYIKDLYFSGNAGAILVYNSLGISRGLFVFLLTIIAVSAFIITDRIEKNVKYGIPPQHPKYNKAVPATILSAIVAFIMLFIPVNKHTYSSEDITKLAQEYQDKFKYSNIEEIAYSIYYNIDKFFFIDTRTNEDYQKFCIPKALYLTYEDITKPEYSYIFNNPYKTVIFYDNGTINGNKDNRAQLAFIVAYKNGYKNCKILQDGIKGFKEYLTNLSEKKDTLPIGNYNNEFQFAFSKFIAQDTNLTKPVKKKEIQETVKKVKGGC